MLRLLATRRRGIACGTVAFSLLAAATAGSAHARLVEADRPERVKKVAAPAALPAAPLPVRAAAAAPGSALACGLVRQLRVCSHGDDAHLADTPASTGGRSASTSSTRIGCYAKGPRVQAVYARPATAPDRYAASLPSFRGWAGAMEKAVDDSARKTGGTRHVRFVSTPNGSSCVLSVLNLVLPGHAFGSFHATISALQERGLNERDMKYLVWVDAKGYCGVATAYEDDKPSADNLNNGAFPSYARIDRTCWGRAETHELMHMLGAVQTGAPHATAGHHCRDGADVMCYDDGTPGGKQSTICPTSHAGLLDCRSDDYFSTAPPARSWLATHWNTASSAFLARGWTDPAPAARPSPSPAATPSSEPESAPERPGEQEPAPLLPLPTFPAIRP